MVITVYSMSIGPFYKEAQFKKALEEVSPTRRERVLGCKAEGEQYRLLAAGVLLERVLKQQGYEPESLRTEEGGKPYLEGVENFYFNLSHSGDYVVCAVGEKPVGVDIQEYRKGTERIPERFFLQEETEDIERIDGTERQERFFRYWTAKEAYGKLTGKGLAQGFDSFKVNLESGRIVDLEKPEQKIYLKEYFSNLGRENDLDKCSISKEQQNYSLTVCSYTSEFAEELQEIQF